MRRVVELHWPALLAGSACAGLAASNWIALSGSVVVLVRARLARGAVLLRRRSARVAAVGAVSRLAGLVVGSAAPRGDESRARSAPRSASRRTAESSSRARRVRRRGRSGCRPRRASFAASALRERVLLVLPVGRSPPRGAILETVVRVAEPRPADGWLRRARLARAAGHPRRAARREPGDGSATAAVSPVSATASATASSVRSAEARPECGARSCSASSSARTRGYPTPCGRTSGLPGLAHLLAVSGQNVAFLAFGVYGLGWLLRLSEVVRELATLGAIAAYVLAVGWQPSVIRAGVAGALASLAWLAARPRDRWHFLALGALVLLAWAPTSLLDPGLPALVRGRRRNLRRRPSSARPPGRLPGPARVADVLGVAVVCGLVTAPIVLFHFGEAPIYTVPANAVALPAAPAVLGLGLLAAVGRPVLAGGRDRARAGWPAGRQRGSSSWRGSSPPCPARRSMPARRSSLAVVHRTCAGRVCARRDRESRRSGAGRRRRRRSRGRCCSRRVVAAPTHPPGTRQPVSE